MWELLLDLYKLFFLPLSFPCFDVCSEDLSRSLRHKLAMKLSVVLSFLYAARWVSGAAIPDQNEGVCNDQCVRGISRGPNWKDDCSRNLVKTVLPAKR